MLPFFIKHYHIYKIHINVYCFLLILDESKIKFYAVVSGIFNIRYGDAYMVFELCEDNAGLLSSVTVMFLNNDKEATAKDNELIGLVSEYIKNIIVASSIEEAKEKAEGRDIDILITDFNLSDSESIEFPVYIRRNNPSCSIIIYTSKNDPDHLLEAINLKVDKYIIKPCSFKDFIKAIISLAEFAFTLKSLYSTHNVTPSTHLDAESYDTISQSIDDLRAVIAKMVSQHCMESMPIIHTLKSVIAKLKYLLKSSY